MADIYESGLEPARCLFDNAHLLPKGKALDIAMGNGRNAVYLVRMGYEVEGFLNREKPLQVSLPKRHKQRTVLNER